MLATNQKNESFDFGSGTSGPVKEPTRLSLPATLSVNDAMRRRVFCYTTSKPTQKMVIEAIKVIGSTEEKGASVAAIMKWIVGNYAILDLERVKLLVKKAILKALEQGTIQRSATSKGALGASGSFVLGVKSASRTSGKNKKPSKSSRKKTKEASVLEVSENTSE